MNQQIASDTVVSVRPELPYVEMSGFENLSDDERAVQDAMHKFARDVMRPAGIAIDRLSAEQVIKPGSAYWEFMAAAASAGIGFDIDSGDMPPQELARLQAIVIEEFGWGDAGLSVSMLAGAFPNLVAKRSGNQELIELTTGKLGAWIATQPDRGSDGTMLYPGERHSLAPKGNKGNLVAKVSGGDIVINGQSSAWVSNGPVAQVAILSIATDYGEGFFDDEGHPHGIEIIVPLDLPGVSRGKPLEKLGKRALPQGELFFDNVKVPLRYAVSQGDSYWRGHAATWSTAGVAMGPMMTGVARGAFELALEYVHERRQGGALLADHQMVQSRLGAMARKVEMMRAVAHRATDYSSRSPAKHPYYTAAAKVTCTDLAFEVADEALQLFGGYGLSREYPMEKLFRDARAARIEDGENHVLNMKFGYLNSMLYRNGQLRS
ncbi:acyl-CoA dehydrogenase [Pseudomonas laurylsulfatiphila]|jgi:alkylation response protein AidB-like acyl-CoA dehydrogenase|uniref:acyl-CoA dehydrogenase family protein n=1 Tax=Pseudomonas laurylsulfatiphila TaxID=2011015 RepID=UPI003D1AEDAC